MIKVAQCWDDGVATDIHLIEILKKYGAKATFNLNPGALTDERVEPHWWPLDHEGWSFKGFSGGRVGMKELRQVYDGFQVASHCWMHENAGAMPDDQFLEAAMHARTFLEDLFERPCLGFAWPCGRYTDSTCKLMQEAGFAYGRTTENLEDVTKYTHPMALHSNCHYQDGAFLQKYLKAKADGCEYFYFWGHSYEMMDSQGLWDQLEQKIRFISEDPDAVWCDVVDIVR